MWSTRQLAELAGTTVKAVRYYHDAGLLPEPERSATGYFKQYEVPHLLRLLQIRRLLELGIPLARVAQMEPVGDDAEAAIRALDDELAAGIERMTRVRDQLADILEHRGSVYLPAAFAALSDDFSDRQRSLLMVYGSVLSSEAMDQFRALLESSEDSDREFEQLPADADAATIEAVADRLLPVVLRSREETPWVADPAADAPAGRQEAEVAMAEAMAVLYNPAQRQVLMRVHERLADS